MTCALFNTLHSQQYTGVGQRSGLSRERFFLYAFLGGFFWYFFPVSGFDSFFFFCTGVSFAVSFKGYIFIALSYFNWVCWIAPENIIVNQLFGYSSGLGMSLITFDWAQIAYIGSPLATPWWAAANIGASFVAFFVSVFFFSPLSEPRP